MTEHDRIAQGADMLVGNNHQSQEFYSKAKLDSLLDKNDIADIKYFAKFASILKTERETKTILVEATNLKEFVKKNEIEYSQSYSPKLKHVKDSWMSGAELNIIQPEDLEFGDEEAGIPLMIIDELLAKNANLKAGDIIEVFLPTFSSYSKMRVGYVALKKGIFSSPASKNILVDFSAIENMGQLSATYITFTNPKLYTKYEKILKTQFPALDIGQGNSYDYVMGMVKSNTLLLSIALIFLVAIMMLILYSTYLIISKHRMKDIIVFKAVGATPRQTQVILLLEVLAYSVIGIVLGLILARFLLALAIKLMLPQALGIITFPIWKYLITIVISILVTILSTIRTLISISKKTVMELKSDTIKYTRSANPIVAILLTVLLVALIISYFFVGGYTKMALAFLLIFVVILWTLVSSSYIFNFFAKIFKKSKFAISAYASPRNGAIKSLSIMLAIVITFSFLIVQLVTLVKVAVEPFNSRYRADYTVVAEKPNPMDYYTFNNEILLKTQGVYKSSFSTTVDFMYPGNEKNSEKDFTIYGISSKEHLRVSTKYLVSSAYEKWDSTNNPIVISNDIALRLNKKIGDKLSVYPYQKDFNNDLFEFEIVGIDYSISQWDQISYCKFDKINHMSSKAVFLISAENNANKEDVFISLRSNVERSNMKQAYALKFQEWAFIDRDTVFGVQSLLAVLQAYIYIVAIIGILNMAIVTSYNRKNELNIYKVSGMSEQDFLKFSLGESLLISSTGGIMGIVASFIINLSVPVFNNIINKYISINPFPYQIVLVFLVSTLLFNIVWMLIALFNKSRKNITLNQRLNE